MEICIPAVGESIHEALLAAWRVPDGAAVRKDEVLCDLETDKVNVEATAESRITAAQAGRLRSTARHSRRMLEPRSMLRASAPSVPGLIGSQ